MNKHEKIPLVIISGTLLLFIIVVIFSPQSPIVTILFALSPLLVGWLVYNVIRFGTYTKRELKEDEEWGYADKDK